MMMDKSRSAAPRLTSLLIILCLLSVSSLWADSASIRTRYDNYQAVFRQYIRAVQQNTDAATIQRLAEELALAKTAYLQAVNPTQAFIASATAAASATELTDVGEEAAPLSLSSTGSATASAQSTEEATYDRLVAKLYEKDRQAIAAELCVELQNFIAAAKNPYFIMEATFRLAELVHETTKSAEKAQKILEAFRQTAPTAEAKRLAQVRIQMLHQEGKIQKQRQTFENLRIQAGQLWQTYYKTSWLAFPSKLARLSSYFWTNSKRKSEGKALQKLSQEYDKLVQATYLTNTLDQFTSSQLIPCNDVAMLINGRSSFARRFELAAQAKDKLYLQTLLYYNDETGIKLADLLVERAQAGVDVKVIVDDAFAQGRKSSIIRRLENGGVSVQLNNPLLQNPLGANFRSHQKMFVVDDEVAIVGGMNIANEYAYGEIEEHGWRDTDLEIRGPAVAEIAELFESNWLNLQISINWEIGDKAAKPLAEKQEKAGILPNRDRLIRGPLPVYFTTPPEFANVRVRWLKTFPKNSKDDDILDLFTAYLATAKQEVILESAYFIPHPRLKEAIKAACKRGVKVRIITNSTDSNNHPNAGWAGRACYEEAIRAGAEIYEWRGAQTLHSKVTWFDGFAVTIGAYNLNSRSNSCDSEDVISIEDRRFAALFRKVLDRDLRRCRRITLDDINQWRSTFSDRFKMDFFKQFKSVF
jgi:cardiolipin synthase